MSEEEPYRKPIIITGDTSFLCWNKYLSGVSGSGRDIKNYTTFGTNIEISSSDIYGECIEMSVEAIDLNGIHEFATYKAFKLDSYDQLSKEPQYKDDWNPFLASKSFLDKIAFRSERFESIGVFAFRLTVTYQMNTDVLEFHSDWKICRLKKGAHDNGNGRVQDCVHLVKALSRKKNHIVSSLLEFLTSELSIKYNYFKYLRGDNIYIAMYEIDSITDFNAYSAQNGYQVNIGKEFLGFASIEQEWAIIISNKHVVPNVYCFREVEGNNLIGELQI